VQTYLFLPEAIILMLGALSLIKLDVRIVNRSVLQLSRSLFPDDPCHTVSLDFTLIFPSVSDF